MIANFMEQRDEQKKINRKKKETQIDKKKFKKKLTLFSFPNADIKSAHSVEYSKFFKALSMFDI